MAARIKGDVLSRLDGSLFSLKFLVMNSWSIFISPFHARQLILPCTWRGHVIFLGKFLQTRSVEHIAIGLLKQDNCKKSSSKSGLYVHTLFGYWKGKVRHAVEEEAPFLCQLDRSLTLLDVVLTRLDFDFDTTRFG